jgi:hypothetical protein
MRSRTLLGVLVVSATSLDCGSRSAQWRITKPDLQSTTGSQPYAVLASDPSSSYALMLECTWQGALLLSFGGGFSEGGATVHFDAGPPVVLPTVPSGRGHLAVDLRAPLEPVTSGGTRTAEERLRAADELAVEHPRVGTSGPLTYDISKIGPAIDRLGCPSR